MRAFWLLTWAVAVFAALLSFFLVRRRAWVGRVSGLWIVVGCFVPLSLWGVTLILSFVLFVLGFFSCGWSFGAATVWARMLVPGFLGLFSWLFPTLWCLTAGPAVAVLWSVLVVGLGLGILLRGGASWGGLAIFA
ncbi:YitT family protein [Gemmiger formicilis]|uniref:YitT family protein n=1 Tax=Gemmiger formicilis TaxID=745368 RepID=UPI0013564E89|nr:YitT family protein [Gemmiger formicilis]